MLLAISGVAIACTDAGSPTTPSASSPSFSTAEQEMSTEERQQRHEELKLQLKSQKERIKAERELRKAAYELARDEWKDYKREWKRANKGKKDKTVDLLRCRPRPYEGEAAIIGPDGGTLHIGEHELVIPRGALAREELIIAEAPTSSLVNVEFYPEGLTFSRSAKLNLSYKGCQVPSDIDLRLAYLGWGLRILELPPSFDQKDLSEVTGDIDHFSRYAIAY
jgi:hypothetical protein